MSLGALAASIFRGTLARVGIPSRFAARVRCERDRLLVDGSEYRLDSYGAIGLIAIGKAALAMSEALLDALGASPAALAKLDGVVVASGTPARPHPQLRYFVGAHPLPTLASVRAAEAILAALHRRGPDDLVIFMISGGASAMVERALDASISFEHTVELYRLLLHSGLPIAEMNCVRKHYSATKGGRLAAAALGATQISLLVSDVPGDDLSVIGSGPSVPDPSTLQESERVLAQLLSATTVDHDFRERLQRACLKETPKPGDSIFAQSSFSCLLSPSDVMSEARAIAEHAGFHVETDNTCDDWDHERAAEYLLQRLRTLRKQYGRVCLLSGGELAVPLPPHCGVGGRNQHFALGCALRLSGSHERITVLSAGTDGVDGNSPAAGAVVDERTCELGRAKGLDARDYYDRFDSYNFFERIGAAVVTGPTENNLRDLRILLAEA